MEIHARRVQRNQGSPDERPLGPQVVMDPVRIDVAMIGARQHYALPKLLHRAGLLGRLYTDFYLRPEGVPARALRSIPRALRPRKLERLLGNSDAELPVGKVVSFNGFGLWYRWGAGRTGDVVALERIYARMGAPFARRIIRHGLQETRVLYSYNGSALELFRRAKERGIRCILEQIHIPQSVTRELLSIEMGRWPGWEPGLEGKMASRVMEEREKEEWALADLILAGAPQVVDSLVQRGVPHPKCRAVPYGIPLEMFPPKPAPGSERRKLRVLFAGGVGLRKGAPYLLEALRSLGSGKVEARFAGQVLAAREKLRPYEEVAAFLGPVPRSGLMALYRWADVLVLPSICEGSSLVTYEALASGLPVVATPNAGAWLRESVDGLTVPAQDIGKLATVLERLHDEPRLLLELHRSALAGRSRLGLEAYAERVLEALR